MVLSHLLASTIEMLPCVYLQLSIQWELSASTSLIVIGASVVVKIADMAQSGTFFQLLHQGRRSIVLLQSSSVLSTMAGLMSWNCI
jgi:hypothetical protein